jgi:hypothetical protein
MTVETSSSRTLEDEVRAHPERFRVLTGDPPTGPLDLGHYFGTLANRVRLQRAGVEVFVVIADYQVITDRDGLGDISSAVREVVLDYLAAGIEPASGDRLHRQRGSRAQPAHGALPQPGDGARPQPHREGRSTGHARARDERTWS